MGVMMMRKICVCSPTVNTGATTTSAHLALGLALSGQQVLLINAEPETHLSQWLGTTPSIGLTEVLSESMPLLGSIAQIRPGLSLLAYGLEKAPVYEPTMITALFSSLEGHYDFVVINTALSWKAFVVSALHYTSEVLVPVSLPSLSAITVEGLIQFMDGIVHGNTHLQAIYTALTFCDPEIESPLLPLDQLYEHRDIYACELISYSAHAEAALSCNQSLFEFAPGSLAAMEYEWLTETILTADLKTSSQKSPVASLMHKILNPTWRGKKQQPTHRPAT